MAFGLDVSDYSASQQTGTYGKTIKVDISSYLTYSIDFVQASDGTNTGKPVKTGVDLSILQGYLEDVNCPDLAFNYGSEILTIFFKTGTLQARFAFGGKRKVQKLTADTDLLDVPNQRLELVGLFAKEYAWLDSKNKVDEDIKESIQEKELAFRNE